MVHFCQLFLNDGLHEGTRLLSKAAIREMTRDQLPAVVIEKLRADPTRYQPGKSYGLGFQLSQGRYGHVGAHSTSFSIDPQRRAAYIFMTQAIFQDQQTQPIEAFERAAESEVDADAPAARATDAG
jgi:CubicO group peptidase (beta-lactamase class C family)